MSAISKFKVTTTIREILLENPNITKLVGDRIKPVIAPKDTDGDFILYQRDEYSKDYTKMGVCSEKCRVWINAISESYRRSQELAYQINESLEGYHTDLNLDIKLIDSTEEPTDGKYIQILLFEIK